MLHTDTSWLLSWLEVGCVPEPAAAARWLSLALQCSLGQQHGPSMWQTDCAGSSGVDRASPGFQRLQQFWHTSGTKEHTDCTED